MTLFVVSDVHERAYRLSELLDKHPRHDGFLFLGDGLRAVERESERINGLAAVAGNCDGISLASLSGGTARELLLDLDGVRVLMMHGHAYGVKSGLDRAIAHAQNKGADVLLFGHTHIPFDRYFAEETHFDGFSLAKPLYVFNPGSLGEPRGGAPSYGVLEIRNGVALLSHGKL